ncbi:sigma-54 dependent transcriptional regulator [Candidatus Parabeggiatoa sp. HSG14]|uniref:sigma-54-dependent transcriptional regulator n=1 Tax=Candidatus Parabeggiatoa sp. HSG14 TaxID=3055593 RepID=UPI0025A8A6F8|nr:sigma-54 dependent transcriptional regulator [Thiotrichales bacterium HSG14]
MDNIGKILIVDDELVALKNLKHVMKKEGYAVTATQSGQKALKYLEEQNFDVVLTDLRMEKVDGQQILKKCQTHYPDTEVILITGYATLESAVEAMKQGAFYYIGKPFRLDDVRQVVKEALAKVQLKKENCQLRRQLADHEGDVQIITQAAQMQKLLKKARQVAPTDCNILISGESGTGKELLASYLHQYSKRAKGPFVAVNCGAFSGELLANELFGHEKGAFTGAITQKQGIVEAANTGTLFLDEVTEMPLSMQVKLLRVIQEQEVQRLGSTTPIKVNVRFIAATNRNLTEAVKSGQFRQDLFFRLNVVSLHLPPLVQRTGDIILLSQYFLQRSNEQMKKAVSEIAPAVNECLTSYGFPGNVRELENIIAHGVALARGTCIELEDLPEDIRTLTIKTFRHKKEGGLLSLEEQETAYIKWVLKEVNDNKTLAAKVLGIDRVSLWRKLKSDKTKEVDLN